MFGWNVAHPFLGFLGVHCDVDNVVWNRYIWDHWKSRLCQISDPHCRDFVFKAFVIKVLSLCISFVKRGFVKRDFVLKVFVIKGFVKGGHRLKSLEGCLHYVSLQKGKFNSKVLSLVEWRLELRTFKFRMFLSRILKIVRIQNSQ